MTENTSMKSGQPKTINMVAAALGGEGGGVFTDWLIDVAEANDWMVQTTSLAGVAQRTGATIYYIELFPRALMDRDSSQMDSKPPVMSLFPAQGDIDIAISSEIAEAGRMLQRGFITPDRTTLISSTHRVYSIYEKEQLGDGIIDPNTVLSMAGKYAKSFISYDMDSIAKNYNSVISSAMLGAVAGSAVLPFSKQSYEQVIRQADKAIESNLAAFNDSYEKAQALVADRSGSVKGLMSGVQHFDPHSPSDEDQFSLPVATTDYGRLLLKHVADTFPRNVHEVIYHGLVKTLDYQDYRYGEQYLNELERFLPSHPEAVDEELLTTIARYLALWMCFEDVPRVAQLKIRSERMDEIRQEAQVEPDQVFYVTEYFKPRVEEMCAIMPASLGESALNSRFWRAVLNRFSGGKKLRTNTLTIFFALRFLASLRRFRRHMLGYKHEYAMISAWLDAIEQAMHRDQNLALEIAKSGRLVKGYGKTRERTTSQLMGIVDQSQQTNVTAAYVTELREAALSADDNQAFDLAMAKTA